MKNLVSTLTRGTITTATSVVRHPIRTTSMAVGLVKGTAEAGSISSAGGSSPPLPASAPAPVVRKPAPVTADDPRDAIPGPDVVADEPPTIDELPEPIVIEADDDPGEAFHHEPKAAGRVSEHEGFPGDREEREHYAEEIPDELAREQRPL